MLYYYNGSTINVVSEIWGICLSLLCLIVVSRERKRAYAAKILFVDFIHMAICTAAVLFCDLLGIFLDGTMNPVLSAIYQISVYLVFVLNALLIFLVALYFIHNIEEEFQRYRWKLIYASIFIFTLVAETLNHFYGWIYYFDAANVYHRGPYFWISHVAAFLTELGLAVMILMHWKKILPRRRKLLILFLFLPCLAQALQLLINGIGFLYISDIVIMLLVMASIYGLNSQMVIKQQEELSQMTMNSMISQIQPHFLYNVLSAIMGIEGNPPETKKALADFGKYLRGNMDVLKSSEPISFVKEMQHVRAYVGLEKLRFQERLSIDYDLQVLDFEIPALAVQMMVENAIKHGIRPKPEGGSVLVKTRELPSHFMIQIIDDGVGFDNTTPKDESRSHVGLENTRERLRIMVEGELSVQSIPGKGTVVTIMIPKMEYEEDEYFSS